MSRKKTKKTDIHDTRNLGLLKELAKLGGEGYGLPLKYRTYETIERIPTGSIRLDKALDGGIPKGRFTELFGAEGTGKTSLCYSIMAQCQAAGGEVVFIDVEHNFDIEYAKKFGVVVDDVHLVQPDNAEAALETLRLFLAYSGADLIVIDSIAALSPKAEIEGNIGDAHMGLMPRILGQAFRIAVPLCAQSKTAVILVNQIRDVMGYKGDTTPGGRSAKHTPKLRLRTRRVEMLNKVKDDTNSPLVGMLFSVGSPKNQVGKPFTNIELTLSFEEGIDKYAELLKLGLDQGKIIQSGSWYKVGEDNIGQGKEAARQWLKDQPDLCAAIAADFVVLDK